jgi:iron complex outermembrane receptor protein
MQKFALLVILSVYISLPVLSQITGRTIDSQSGLPLSGTSIQTNTGYQTKTNSEGYFSISGDEKNIQEIKFSFVGYKQVSVLITDNSAQIEILLEPEIQTLQELTITISGIKTSRNRSTGSVSSLSKYNLKTHSGIALNDAINKIPGVYMSGGAYNTNRLTIRGIGSRNPYSSNRIRAYLDDIPLTSGDGSTSIDDIDLANISGVDIMKGPSSAVYGSGLGGIVRLTSWKPDNENFTARISTEVASFGTSGTSVRAGFKTGKGAFSIVYSNSHSNGYRQNSAYTRNSFLLSGGHSFNKTKLDFTLLYTNVNAHIPSSLNKNDFTKNPQIAAANWLAIRGFEEYSKFLWGISAVTNYNKTVSTKISVFGTIADPYESRPFNILDENSKSIGYKEQIRFSKNSFELIVGGESFFEGFNWKVFETLSGQKGNLIASNQEKRIYFNGFVLSGYKFGSKLSVEIGLNVNVLTYKLKDVFAGDTINVSGKFSYAPVFSPRFGVNYVLKTNTYLHSSIGHGFSAPSLEETLLPNGQINNDLKPESGWNTDIGIRGEIFEKRLTYDLTAYYIALSNLLVTKRISEEVFTGVNAGKTTHAGLEALLNFDVLAPGNIQKWKLDLTTSLTLSKNSFKDFIDDSTVYSGNNLPGIPSVIMNNELKLKLFNNYELMLTHKLNGKQFMDDSNQNEYEYWQTTDFRLSFNGKTGNKKYDILIYAGVKNLFDEHYAGMILVNAPSFGGAASRYYYPGLPRNYFAGIRLEFN